MSRDGLSRGGRRTDTSGEFQRPTALAPAAGAAFGVFLCHPFRHPQIMMNEIHHVALFRYGVLGSLISRADLPRGELKAALRELAARDYAIPGSRNSRLSEKTIEAWYYAWRRGGIEALEPKARSDRGQSSRPNARTHAVPST